MGTKTKYFVLGFVFRVKGPTSNMGVARILERVVRTTSRDVVDVTRVTACSSPRSSQHVASRGRQLTILKFNFTTARIRSTY